MGDVQVFNRTFLRGWETTRDEDGAPDWSGFRRFLNTRVAKDEAERRQGAAVIATLPEVGDSLSLLGASGEAKAAPEVWALDWRGWILELLVLNLEPTATKTLLETGSLTISYAGGQWTFAIGSALLQTPTDTVAQHLALLSNEDGYTLFADGVPGTTVAWSAPSAVDPTLELGGASCTIDFMRLRLASSLRVPSRDLRLLNPRGRNVLACYRDGPYLSDVLGQRDYWMDHSIYENHFKLSGSHASAGRLSPVPHTPVQGIESYVDEKDQRHLVVVAGGKEYDAAYE